MNNKKMFFLLVAWSLAFLASITLDAQVKSFFASNDLLLLDLIFGVITNFGVMLIAMFVIPVLTSLKDRKFVNEMAFSAMSSFLLALVIKIITARDRPYELFAYPFAFINLSFPSMHSMVAFALLPVVSLKFKKQRIFFWAFASLVAFSRVYFGFHFLSDVVFGIFAGYLIGSFSRHAVSFKGKVKIFELKRQAFHLFLGLAVVLMLKFGFLNKDLILVLVIFGLAVSILSKKFRIPVISHLLAEFERKEDLKKLPGKGVIFYFAGIYFSLLFFSKEAAMASIMILAFGDSVSHLFGTHAGKIKNPFSKGKFIEGSLAGFFAGFFAALVFVSPIQAFFASLAAMAVEGIEVRLGAEQVDDNLTIPIAAGLAIEIFRYLT